MNSVYMGRTGVDVNKTVSEIQRILMVNGATAIMTESDSGEATGIAFKIRAAGGASSPRIPN